MVSGREPVDGDRALARRCCISAQPEQAGGVLALPLRLADGYPAACLFALEAAADASAVAACLRQVHAVTASLDGALQRARMARLSGSAQHSEQLRQTLVAAYAVENCDDLKTALAALHQALRGMLYADNFFVVMLDERREWLHFPYFCDPYDHFWEPLPFHEGGLQGSLSAYVVGAGRIVRGTTAELLQQAGHSDTVEEDIFGPVAHDWLGVPMAVGGEVLGALVVQSYDPARRFADGDPSVLSMVAEALAVALHRRRVREALQRTVAERTAELQAAKDAAEEALAALRSTQQQLLLAEKMASLGQLVAGVAHEVNTPLGVALTAASLLQVKTSEFERRQQEGALTRRGLADFLAVAAESSAMILRNLERAAQLVHSFKQVSVDRTTDGRRRFFLDTYIGELLASMATLWRQRPVTVTLQCPSDIEMDSYPGTLGQVLGNLLQNALLHAFASDQTGEIQIAAAELDADWLAITVSDDGGGIAAELQQRIFEPFFTTRRSRGGTGLGLHIVFNLVHHKLGGRVSVSSLPGSGSCFRLNCRGYRRPDPWV
jgi:signal transduction histidine kinase